MDISVDSSNSQVNFNEIPQEELKGKDLDGTESGSSVVLNGDSVTVSVREPESGETVARTVPADETGVSEMVENGVQIMLDSAATTDEIVDDLEVLADECDCTPPEEGTSGTTVPEMSLSEVGEELQKLGETTSEEVANGTVLSESSGAQTTFFDIYALMALLQQVGQLERNAARDLKMAELQTEVASINTQANKQREAGILGMIVSAVTMVAQLAMTAVSIAKSATSIKGSYKTSAAQDVNLEETKSVALQKQGDGPEAAKANLEKLQTKYGGTKAGAKVDEALNGLTDPGAKRDLETARANEAKVTKEQTAVKEAEEAKVKDCDRQIESLTKNANGQVDDKKLGALKTQRDDSANKVKEADAKIAEAKTKTEEAEKAFCKPYDDAQKKLDEEYASASANTKLAEKENIETPSKENANAVSAARQQQKEAGNASKLMSARAAAAKAEAGIKPTADEITNVKLSANMANKVMAEDPAFKTAQSFPQNVLWQSLPHMISNLGQSCSQMAYSLANADATAEQANQKTAEMYRDESNSLFSQAQDLITAARECCKAIIQAESQSVEQIIRA